MHYVGIHSWCYAWIWCWQRFFTRLQRVLVTRVKEFFCHGMSKFYLINWSIWNVRYTVVFHLQLKFTVPLLSVFSRERPRDALPEPSQPRISTAWPRAYNGGGGMGRLDYEMQRGFKREFVMTYPKFIDAYGHYCPCIPPFVQHIFTFLYICWQITWRNGIKFGMLMYLDDNTLGRHRCRWVLLSLSIHTTVCGIEFGYCGHIARKKWSRFWHAGVSRLLALSSSTHWGIFVRLSFRTASCVCVCWG